MQKRFPHFGGFESTRIWGSGEDVLGVTRHDRKWRADLQRLREAGICKLRYPIPWHTIEAAPGVYDWSWIDGPMRFMQDHQMDAIVDPLHHVSFPDWLQDGFANPAFPELYAKFVGQVAQRYPWVASCTPVNEPLPTAVLCGLTGAWYPHRRSQRDFVRILIHLAKAICLATGALRSVRSDMQIVSVDACEHHFALEPEALQWVKHVNERRFLVHDLVLGRVDARHPLYGFLQENAFTAEDEHWFRNRPVSIDVVGPTTTRMLRWIGV